MSKASPLNLKAFRNCLCPLKSYSLLQYVYCIQCVITVNMYYCIRYFKRFPLERKDLRITLFCLLLHLFCPSVAFRDRSERTTATLQDSSKSVLSFSTGPLLQKDPTLDPLNALCLSKRFTAQTENHTEKL